MTLAADIATDYEVFDGTEVVSFQARKDNQAADGAAATGLTFLAEPVNRPGIQNFTAGLLSTDVTGSLWGLGSTVPKAGDTITRADGTVWTVLQAQQETLATRWRIALRKRVS